MRMNAERVAQAGIVVQFLALIRILSEYFRLKHFGQAPLTLDVAEPLIKGALITAVCTAASVLLFFCRRYRFAAAVAALTVMILLVYKLILLR